MAMRGRAARWGAPGLVVAAALALRLPDLGSRPMHHDEAQEAWLAWRLTDAGEYVYDPVWHGPLSYYLDAVAFLVLGVSDAAARVPSALCGAALAATPFLLRARLGRAGALTAAALLCASPALLYYSRFSRNDLLVALLTAGMLVVAVRWWDRPRRWHPVALAALLAAQFGTKESALITSGVAVAIGIGAAVLHPGALQARVRAVGGRAVLVAVLTFVVVYVLVYSVGFTDPGGIWRGIYEGPRYWLQQHDLGRGDRPWLYLLILVVSEGPILLLGVAGGVLAWRRADGFGMACALAAAALLAAYTMAGERFPWLITQPLVPLALLAGITGQALWGARARALPRVGIALAGAGVLAMGAGAIDLSFGRAEDPRDVVVSVQTTPEAERMRDRVLALLERPGTRLWVDSAAGAAWPWGWWLRGRAGLGFADLTQAGPRLQADLLLLTDAARVAHQDQLGDWVGQPFALRAGWRREGWPPSPRAWWGYLVHRRPWSAPGEDRQWLYVRRGLAASARDGP